jgi:uncharacterized protein YwgA
LERRDWLLLLLGFKGHEGQVALDPVRIQKGMFLLAQEGDLPEAERYDFTPYHYGPYSFDLRRDLEALEGEGLVKSEPAPGYSWRRYRLSAAGLMRARDVMRHEAPSAEVVRTYQIKVRVTEQSFNELLRDVYAEHPDYATRSIFRG